MKSSPVLSFALRAMFLTSCVTAQHRRTATRSYFPRALWNEPIDLHVDDTNVKQVQFTTTPADTTYDTAFTDETTDDDITLSDGKLQLTNDEKHFLDLFTASNFSALGSDKLMWIANSDQFKQSEAQEADGVKGDNNVNINAKYLKTVSLCDKTLAITDFINDEESNVPALIKCELFDLEKNPEKAYSEGKRSDLRDKVT